MYYDEERKYYYQHPRPKDVDSKKLNCSDCKYEDLKNVKNQTNKSKRKKLCSQ
jgi:hypothetical protein